MKEISVLGCGWLGLPLAQKLTNRFSVKGSTTTEGKLSLLENAGIMPYLISLSENNLEGQIDGFLSCDILVINIPPKKNDGRFSDKIKILLPHIEAARVQTVLFVSSTSVYGETVGTIDEKSHLNPDTDNAKQLVEAEKLLTGNRNFNTTILRFGGLIGGERHPVKYLSGKQNDNPDARVNLIDRDDCIGIINKIITLGKCGETYNAVSPFHPTRKEYYTRKAIEFKLPPPTFTDNSNEGKIICVDKVINELGYVFEKPFL